MTTKPSLRSRTADRPLRSTRESDDRRACSQPDPLDEGTKRITVGFLVTQNVSDRRVLLHP